MALSDEVVEAAANGLRPGNVGRQTALHLGVARSVLEAALPVLAESDELIERLARALYDEHGRHFVVVGWGEENEPHKDQWRRQAREWLRDLFGLSSTEGKDDHA